MATFSLHIGDEEWTPTGDGDDPTSRLNATFDVNGLSMHLEAWAVKLDSSDIQRAVDPSFCDLEGLYNVFEDTCFDTLRIRGRDYVLVATPYEA